METPISNCKKIVLILLFLHCLKKEIRKSFSQRNRNSLKKQKHGYLIDQITLLRSGIADFSWRATWNFWTKSNILWISLYLN